MTLPDDTLARAVAIYNANVGFEHCSPLALEAALEASAADIWEEAYETGVHDAWMSMDYDGGQTPAARVNPYRTERS